MSTGLSRWGGDDAGLARRPYRSIRGPEMSSGSNTVTIQAR